MCGDNSPKKVVHITTEIDVEYLFQFRCSCSSREDEWISSVLDVICFIERINVKHSVNHVSQDMEGASI